MIRKFLKRCFLAGVLVAMFAIGTLACGCFLACSTPSSYAAALEEPVDEADVEAAIAEIEQRVRSMELFVQLDAAGLAKLQAMPEQAIATTKLGRPNADVSLADALQTVKDSQGETQDTFVLSLTQRHLNALLNKEVGAKEKNLRRPYVSLQGDMIRFAVTFDTPAAEVALSCDFELSKTKQTNLTFELHALSVGRLPLPATAILKQIMKTQPTLPQGIELKVDGEYPTLTFTAMPDHGKLQLDGLHIADGMLHLTFRRTADDVIAAKNLLPSV